MEFDCQHTISQTIEMCGVGLHSGAEVKLVLRPLIADRGVFFRRSDLAECSRDDQLIEATPTQVGMTQLGTTIVNQAGVSVATIEHLMAALALCGVDNVIVDVDGPEIPIFDGSATPFVDEIKRAGLERQSAPRRVVEITDSFIYEEGDRSISVEPLDHPRLDLSIEFEDCLIGSQSLSVRLDCPRSRDRLAFSRTFCRLEEIECMRTAGLIRGGSLENAIVVDGDRVLNEETLRDPKEFALHKALDLIGDLYLLGGPILGHIQASKPGHDLNTKFARALEAHLRGAKSAEAIQLKDHQLSASA